MPALAAGTG